MSTRDSKRILVIAYHFGPGAATGGLRWNAMTGDLARRGWQVDVITMARALGNGLPQTLPYQPQEGVRVHAVRRTARADQWFDYTVNLKRRFQALMGRTDTATVRDNLGPADVKPWRDADPPGAYAKVMTNLNALKLLAGDAQWARSALRLARALVAQRPDYRAVIVSTPPHVTQTVGIALSREFGIPYLPDFRDPWIFGRPRTYAFSAVERTVGTRLERRALAQADVVICNTDRARDAVAQLPHARGRRIVGLPNGYDALASVAAPDATAFRIVFTGWLYPFMDVRPLMAAVGRLKTRTGLTGDVLRLEFMGTEETFGTVPLASLARAYGIEDCFALHPKSTRREAIAMQQEAAVLVVFGYPHDLSVPTKFYDHAQLRGSMLLIAHARGALADAAAQIGLAVHDPADEAGIDAALDAALDRWRRRDFGTSGARSDVFNRQHQSARLETLLLSLGASPSRDEADDAGADRRGDGNRQALP